MTLKNDRNSRLFRQDAPTRLGAIFFQLTWITIAAVFFGLILFVTNGDQLTIIRWFSYVSPWLAGVLLLLAVPAFLIRKTILGFSFLLLALPLILPFYQMFGYSKTDPAAGQVYKVMTYSKMGRNNNINSVARVVLNEKPDILFMQEISDQEAENLIRLVDDIYDGAPLFYLADEKYGLILSRYKVTSLLKNEDFSQAAEIELPEKSVRVWNVHLHKSIGNTDLQYQMTDQLADQIAAADKPVIVAGDFNATVVNYPYKKIKQHLDNAFENAGSGFGFTFPSPARRMGIFTPFMRIDHIFYSRQFDIHKSYVVEQSGDSDHYPVVAILSLKENED